MNKIFCIVVLACAALYLSLHLLTFGLNAEWRNRNNDEAFKSGEKYVTYYSINIF